MKTKKTDVYTSNGREVFYYQIYGLTLRTNQPLPSLVSASTNAPVDIEVETTGETQSELLQLALTADYSYDWHTENKSDGAYIHLCYHSDYGKLALEINPIGNKIKVDWENSRFKEVTALLVGGGVLGYAMRLQGLLCLHANVVAVGQYAIAIVGEKGAGKSTTTAALAKRGYSILSDDIAALKQDGNTFFAQPGYPRLRLWKSAIHTLYGSEKGLEKVFQPLDKYYIELTAERNASEWKFQPEPLPLAAIYILEPRHKELTNPVIEPVSAVTALLNLMMHRSANLLKLERKKQAREWEAFSHIASSVSIRRVKRPDDLSKLPELCDAIINDAQLILAIRV
ncbi:serine/threonine protein kinase [Nostoc sp.]|uniref:serine/threonine protein kinase n=1 Tax=Nostoc sp. TaxID=1180 RepID=UPI002FF449B5